jgi:hypothetical protein
MKYMIMMNGPASNYKAFGAMPPADIKRHIEFMHQVHKDLTASGELVDAQGLAPPHETKIIRAQTGAAPVITDGPFPEAKEFLAGYWIVDVRSPERAIEIAAHVSASPGFEGKPLNMPIELRPIGVAPEV